MGKRTEREDLQSGGRERKGSEGRGPGGGGGSEESVLNSRRAESEGKSAPHPVAHQQDFSSADFLRMQLGMYSGVPLYTETSPRTDVYLALG